MRPTTRRGSWPESVARGLDAVAADIEQGSAAGLDVIANVGGIVVEVAEESGYGTQLTDAACAQQFADAQPLRVAADHEGFADLYAGEGADGEKGFGFGDGDADGLFTEDVFAGFGGFDGPRHMHLIGQRIVDGINVRVGEQLFVRSVGFGNSELRGRCLCFG